MQKMAGRKRATTNSRTKRQTTTLKKAYAHPESAEYGEGYCSQFNMMWGATIECKAIVHKAGGTILMHLQKTHYLRYWKTRRGAGGWAENADIEGHADVYRRAHKGNPRGLSCAHYKEMDIRHPSLDIQHRRNSKYEPSTLEAEACWSREVVGRWMEVCVDLVAENVRTTLSGANIRGIGGRLAGTHPVDARATQGLALRLGVKLQDVQWEHVEASIRHWWFHTDLAERLNCPHCNGGGGHKRPPQTLLRRTNGGGRKAETQHTADRGDTREWAQAFYGTSTHSHVHPRQRREAH